MIGRIEAASNAGEAAFLASRLHQDAVLRNLHTVTETTQRLSAELKSSDPAVDWAKLAAFRNVLVHDHLGIDIELVWTVVSRDIPEFKSKVLQILEEITWAWGWSNKPYQADSRCCHASGLRQLRARTVCSLTPSR